MFNIFFYLIVVIILIGNFSEFYLDWLNAKMWSDKVPQKLKNIIDQEKYKRSQNYYRANKKFGNISATFHLLVILSVLFIGAFSMVDEFAASITENQIFISLAFFALLGLASSLLGLPFSWYATFVIEERFGFNKTSRTTFVTDQLKGLFLALIIGIPVMGLITWIYYETGTWFWIYVWIVITAFSLFMNMFYSELIVPLFNRQKPLEEGELRTEIEELADRSGFKLTNIYTIDGSKRSTKANAYFSGLGPKKRIVLYDTLINDLSIKEIVAVLAHEIGHYKKKHSLIMLFYGILQTGIMLFIFSLLANNKMLSSALAAETPSFHISLLAFMLIYSPISRIISLFMNFLSRRHEYQADSFAMKVYDGKHLASALKKLSVKNLSNLNPHPVFVFVHYSHPPLLQRLENLEIPKPKNE